MIFIKVYRSMTHAIRGLRTVWKEEHNFRVHFAIALAVLISIFYFDISFIESSLLIIAIVLVLGAEIVNTAMEDLCNKIEPNHDPIIGKIKDVLAAFVLIAALGAAVLGVMVYLHHFQFLI